jgi:energy-coupling factor transporter ATP-binding protein EcfA2
MSVWDTYPNTYRSKEVVEILRAVRAGECISIVGLSGSGKSNLLGFLAHRQVLFDPCPRFILLDCNRLGEASPQGLFHQMRVLLQEARGDSQDMTIYLDEYSRLGDELAQSVTAWPGVCFLIDRFEVIVQSSASKQISDALRALRDSYKYWFTLAPGTRCLLDLNTELAELFFGHTLWLGSLSASDAAWSIRQYAARTAQVWDERVIQALIEFSWGYPSMLRAVCEAYASGAELEPTSLRNHPAVEKRVAEFWTDAPDETAIRNSGLWGHPILGIQPKTARPDSTIDEGQLTAKEHLLIEYLRKHPGQVCEKDDLIHAVWPEDKIFQQGVRDDSLAQLVRRLRLKIEPDATQPRYIHAIPGRGYRFTPDGNA